MFDVLSEKFSDAFKTLKGQSKISETNIEETLKEVRTALLAADVNFKVVKSFINNVKEKALGAKVTRGVNASEQFIKIVHDELAQMMGGKHEALSFKKAVSPILIVGLNGAGKTTFTGKLALHLRGKEKKDVYLVPADNFRPAAKDQLITHAKNIGVEYFDSDLSMTSAEIAKAGYDEARRLNKDVVIIDTAGRLEIDDQLMGELVDVKKQVPDAETLLVADAMTGQVAVDVSKTFHEKIGLTGIVLSKMDSDARGGAALSMRQVTQVPIRFLSVGEKMKDLEAFHPDRLAKRILDMGDVLTLVEKAEEAIDEKEAEKMMKKMEKNQFTIDDFIKQMEMVGKLGSMGSLMKMIPGMGGMLREMGDDKISEAEGELKSMKVLISSMTKAERKDHKIINESRIKRIARGSGRKESDVSDFITKFEQMKKMMSGMMGMLKGGAMPGMPDSKPGFRQQSGGQKQKKRKSSGKGRGPFGGGFFK